MKAFLFIFRRPGIYVYAMLLVWLLPFLLRDTLRFFDDWRYFRLYAVPLLIFGAMMLLMNVIDSRVHFWKRLNRWIQYTILVGAYVAASFLTLYLSIFLDLKGYLLYQGDAAGNIGMAYFPSSILAVIVGFVWTLILVLIDIEW
jgi:hypothetical protein